MQVSRGTKAFYAGRVLKLFKWLETSKTRLACFMNLSAKKQVRQGSRSVWDEIDRLVIEVQTQSSNAA